MERSLQTKPSDKFKIIDQLTYEKIQQNSSTANTGANASIRNAKYRRKSGVPSDLLNLVKPSNVAKKKSHLKLKRVIDTAVKNGLKHRGKQRENGRKKKKSRLKKRILRHRESEEKQEQRINEFEDVLQQLTTLTISPKQSEVTPKRSIHSNRFCDYCDNCTTTQLVQLTDQLLRELNHFQRRAYAIHELKAKAHRRFVVGFREVQSFLRIKKIKLVLIATDCDPFAGQAGLNQSIASIKALCKDQQIPVAFALQRRQMAYALYKKALIGCVGIINYDGSQALFSQLLAALKEAQNAYLWLVQQTNKGTKEIEEYQ
uniref:Ribosomal protein eL8/eL30/eS12/Gadd45 domain-containing protein n=1 Tax=Glossina palpalis gambiensis TaxID=67801 RepID=A0A1B0AKK4_9MUSC